MSRNDTAIKDWLIQTEKEMFHLGLWNKWREEGIQFVSAVPPFQVKNNWEGNTPPILTFASVRFLLRKGIHYTLNSTVEFESALERETDMGLSFCRFGWPVILCGSSLWEELTFKTSPHDNSSPWPSGSPSWVSTWDPLGDTPLFWWPLVSLHAYGPRGPQSSYRVQGLRCRVVQLLYAIYGIHSVFLYEFLSSTEVYRAELGLSREKFGRSGWS